MLGLYDQLKTSPFSQTPPEGIEHLQPSAYNILGLGDQVLFGKYSGTEVKVEGEELLVMREEDIMAVIED